MEGNRLMGVGMTIHSLFFLEYLHHNGRSAIHARLIWNIVIIMMIVIIDIIDIIDIIIYIMIPIHILIVMILILILMRMVMMMRRGMCWSCQRLCTLLLSI